MPEQDPYVVMVVDDSRVSREVILKEFEEDGLIKVVEFSDAVSAFTALNQEKPNLIISDLEMPGMNGYQFCEAVRFHKDFMEIPFILVSSCVNEDVISEVLQKGVTEAFQKPFAHYDLYKMVQRYINGSRENYEHTVLLVDDSLSQRKFIKSYLIRMNINVIESESAEDADEVLQKSPVDLVIVDHILQGKTGVEWCKELRASKEQENVPIIGISSDKEVAVGFIQAGADDFLTKPFRPEEFNARIRNILTRYQLNHKLEEAVQREQALNQQKNRLLGMAAHDIRNPLVVVKQFSELALLDFDDTEFVQNSLERMKLVAAQCLDLLSEVLDLSAIESGKVELKKEPKALSLVIEQRLELMQEIAKKKSIELSFQNRLGMDKDQELFFDVSKVAQVIDNLLTNAIKFSQEGKRVTVTLDQQIEGLIVEVKDQGQGIPKEELDKVFRAFQKTSVRTTAGESSSGLGLAIVKKIIEAHDGNIWVDSKVGEGSSFTFLVPLA